MTSPLPELLAPASNLTAALTAFDAGADAVYAGLEKFNARERGDNFSLDDFAKLVAYARKQNRKVYLTLNTLIKETELNEVVDLLGDVARIRPDAVIVQDIGLIRILREYFPELTIHASTQAGAHNSAGVNLLQSMGIERVILERQVTLNEVRLIRERTELELEVFVHGALCCCLSGSCLFSSWLGGWSGNRGKCKQPCRRRFFSQDGNGFFFSTNDLYTLDAIPELKELGIASLKIEGRLHKADYVRAVVSAYRMMLDAEPNECDAVLPQARDILSGALGRRWSNGFRSEQDFDKVTSTKKLGVAGQLVGRVQSRKKNGFTIALSRPLHVGDRIRVHADSGEDGVSVVITRLTQDGHTTNRARPKKPCFVFCDKEIPHSAAVFVSGHEEPDLSTRIDGIQPVAATLDLTIAVSMTEISVDIQTGQSWKHPLDCQPAKKRPLAADTVSQEFSKSGSTELATGRIQAAIEGVLFLPASSLREVRRAFWSWAAEHIGLDAVRGHYASRAATAKHELTRMLTNRTAEQTTLAPGASAAEGMTARRVTDCRGADEAVLPDFFPEVELDALREAIANAYRNDIRRFRVCSLFGLELLRGFDGITITASFPLPVCNSAAMRELMRLGVDKALAWVELEQAAIEALVKTSPGRFEIFRSGRIPILSTRAELDVHGEIRDDRGNVYDVIEENGITRLYPREQLSLPTLPGCSDFRDHALPLKSNKTSQFNYEHDWV